MKEKLKLKFCDFWLYFNETENYFYSLLADYYDIEISEDPEIVIFSCHGTDYLRYSCIRVFYTAENVRPDFSGYDFAISFDYSNDARHHRFPLYALYINQHEGAVTKLTETKTAEEALRMWKSKKKFCCMVVSNPKSRKRLDFFEKLSAHKKVDSGGTVLNNVGGPVKDKMDFIRDYRFVLAFENSVHPGYTTEKILEPLLADCIPLYWGDPLVERAFNGNCFLQLTENKTEESYIEEILAIENDEARAVKMLMGPKFKNGQVPDDISREALQQFLLKVAGVRNSQKPVAKSIRRYIYAFRLKKEYYIKRLKLNTKKQFR